MVKQHNDIFFFFFLLDKHTEHNIVVHAHTHTHTHTYIHIRTIYAYIHKRILRYLEDRLTTLDQPTHTKQQ